ncbi:MAG: hypothetical protein KC486_19355, partial [Myxococcales bacterium]|nr:hypothetical protein [Myxococcales bacterium]
EAKAEAKAVKADEATKADADATNSDVPPRKGGCAIDPAGLGSTGAAGLFAVLLVGGARRRR